MMLHKQLLRRLLVPPWQVKIFNYFGGQYEYCKEESVPCRTL
jgi:hypothetical protein